MSRKYRVHADELAAWKSCRSPGRAHELATVTHELGHPWDTANAVAVRNDQLRVNPSASTVPCDVFFLGLGEPPEPSWTKIYGTPYRPPELPWPVTPQGEPYRFFFQLDFSESRDLFSYLPGDILLVFLMDDGLQVWIEHNLIFEWHTAGFTSTKHKNRSNRSEDPAKVFFGRPCRTFDFVDTDPICNSLRDMLSESDVSDLVVPPYTWNAGRFLGLKIGGLPCWQRNGGLLKVDWAPPFRASEQRCASLVYLGGIGTIGPGAWSNWPWINKQEPDSKLFECDDYLLFYDGFQIHLFLDSEFQVQWAIEFP